jgi:hypothetical protein
VESNTLRTDAITKEFSNQVVAPYKGRQFLKQFILSCSNANVLFLEKVATKTEEDERGDIIISLYGT